MPLDTILALVAFAFVTSATPGPNNVMLLASGVNFGLRRSVPHVLGVGLGFAAMLALAGLGLGQALAAWPALHALMKWAGAGYLLWLAWALARASGPAAPAAEDDGGGAAGRRGRPMTFLGAAAFQWVNPKAWMIAVTASATYSVPDRFAWSALLVALVFAPVGVLSSGAWAAGGVWLRRWLAEPRRMRAFNLLMAALLVLSLWPLLAEELG